MKLSEVPTSGGCPLLGVPTYLKYHSFKGGSANARISMSTSHLVLILLLLLGMKK
jgi:hypothetical protein